MIEDVGKKPVGLFDKLSKEPITSASNAQMHKAKLLILRYKSL